MSVQNATQNPQFLDWRDRPEELKKEIDRSFLDVAQSTTSAWGLYNGKKSYDLCGMDDHLLVDRIIEEAPASRKDFYFLDIGAGNFEWGTGLAEHLANHPNLPKDVTFHIISIRGEGYRGPKEESHGPCKIYNLGHVRIENLEEALAYMLPELPLHERIDLAVSHYCFRHLADPVGTFLQAYHLIRPESGLFAFDQFFYSDSKTNFRDVTRTRMLKLLSQTNAPFLMQAPDNKFHTHKSFLMKRPDSAPLELPLTYKGPRFVNERANEIGSGVITKFAWNRELFSKIEWAGKEIRRNSLCGDRDLFEWMRQKVGFGTYANRLMQFSWSPMFKHQEELEPPLLHQAICSKDREAVIALIEGGASIDESDADGNTPLLLAILENDMDLFQILLDRGANCLLANADEDYPHHLAAKQAWGAPYLEILLERNPKLINEHGENMRTALDFGIRIDANDSIELLRAHGGKTLKELNDEFCWD